MVTKRFFISALAITAIFVFAQFAGASFIAVDGDVNVNALLADGWSFGVYEPGLGLIESNSLELLTGSGGPFGTSTLFTVEATTGGWLLSGGEGGGSITIGPSGAFDFYFGFSSSFYAYRYYELLEESNQAILTYDPLFFPDENLALITDVTLVPITGSSLLFGSGLMAIAGIRRRFRRQTPNSIKR